MQRVLIPFDGSDSALRAVRYAASLAKDIPSMQPELLYVLDPVLHRTHPDLSNDEIERLYAHESARILQPAKDVLEQAGHPHESHCRRGSPASEIAEYVREAGCNAIIMGTRGLSPVASLMIGSVALKVIHLTDAPVTLIK
ncbi:MAG TPA: universal stress protein [Noviherbaspirillum sp.]|nr:universal stress protein [Noviherbaspirillum sp.]